MSRAGWIIAVVMAGSACGASPAAPSLATPRDGGPEANDAGVESATPDATPDAPADAATNAPSDAATDAPPDTTDLAVICGGTAPETLDDWEDCYQRRACEWQVGCFPPYPFRDVADCIASGDAVSGGRLAAERRERKRAVAQGRASINVGAFTQCLVRTNATRCNTAFHEPACLTRFAGTIGDTASCFTDVDCRSPGAVCSTPCRDACCVGTCQRKLREGEPCQLSETCEPGLTCTGTKCVSGDVGTPCDAGSVNQCDFGAFCDAATLRCAPTLAPGAACTSLLQCGEDHTCVGLSITSSNPGHCLRISQPGDACDGFCFGNLYCDSASRTCHRFRALGEVCSLFIPCGGANALCNNGVCALRSDVGVTCGGKTCLPGLFCTSELGDPAPICAAPGAVGDRCAAPGHCESFLCSGTNSQTDVCLPWIDTCP